MARGRGIGDAFPQVVETDQQPLHVERRGDHHTVRKLF